MNLNSPKYNKRSETKKCPICYETCTNPVELPCCENHFCMKCLEEWQPGLDNYVLGKRTCPCCRELIPPTQDTMDTIGFYKEVSLSIRTLTEDPNVDILPIPPFHPIENISQIEKRRIYENMETAYGQRVSLFDQKYGSNAIGSLIPSTPVRILVPLSVLQAVRANNYMEAHRFLGSFPIPPRRLNATCPSDSGNTILHAAVQASHRDIVKMLLALGADPNATNAHGQTPLYYAVQADDCRIAKTLIRWGAKKVSAILSVSLNNNNNNNNSEPDRLLAAAADAICKPELAHILKHVEYGRHAKVIVNGINRRGTILYGACLTAYHIQLDACNETVAANTANVEICKPLLFDFRDIDRNAVFPNPLAPPRAGNNDPPGIRRLRQHFLLHRLSRYPDSDLGSFLQIMAGFESVLQLLARNFENGTVTSRVLDAVADNMQVQFGFTARISVPPS